MGNLNVMINVASRDDGLRVLDRVDSATEAGEISVKDVAMVYKSHSGRAKIHQTGDATAGEGALKGGGLGLLVGIFAAALAPGWPMGAGRGVSARHGSGHLRQAHRASRSVNTELRRGRLRARHQAYTSAITTLIDEKIVGGAKVEYDVLSEDAQALLRETLKLDNP